MRRGDALSLAPVDLEDDRFVVEDADLEAWIDEARKLDEPLQKEFVLERDGRTVVLEADATPFSGGGAQGTVFTFHDISVLRRLEGIRTDFVANVSHELKTPLTTIKGFVETLLDGAIHDEKNNVRFLEKIDDHVDRLAHLVSDLLTLTRIESEGKAVAGAPVSWEPVVLDTLSHFEPSLEKKRLECSVERPSQPVIVHADPRGLSQILGNLLENAIMYSPEGGRITVRLFTEGDMGGLEVEDTGIGIPLHEIEHIFERFYRVDKARSRNLGGTGLGLSIVKHWVLSMEGQVGVDSRLGKGSRFRVLLPLARS